MDPFISTRSLSEISDSPMVNVDSDSDIRFYETPDTDTAIEIWSDRGSEYRTRFRKTP